MSDNLETQVQDNPVATQEPSVNSAGDVTIETANGPLTTTDAGSVARSWKATLQGDLKNSPLLGKFEDTPEGLNKAFESHSNLEKLLGHEKVPIPKDINDVEGWNRFSKAMGIPDKAENYGLPDANMPSDLKGITMDKNKFAEIVHAHKLTPAQAKGLWNEYQRVNVANYQDAVAKHQKGIEENVNRLRGEWGDAFETNVELGQTVINKFSDDPEMNDWLTATLSQDIRGIKFLAKIGDQFAENKIGEFSMKKFSLTPEQASEEIQKILKDPKHPYTNRDASQSEHEAAVNYVNSLYASINRSKG